MTTAPQPTDLRCEHLRNPMGLTQRTPSLSWCLEDARPGALQKAWEIEAASSLAKLEAGKADLWRTGRMPGDQCLNILWDGKRLGSRRQVCWRVRVWDMENKPSEWSAVAHFEMGLLRPSDWQAKWIGTPGKAYRSDKPLPYLRRDFKITGPIESARLYITAKGLFECEINGQRLGNDYFTPGWTDYRKRFQVMTYDISELIAEGDNTIGSILAAGWYAGRLGGSKQTSFYGDHTALLAQIEITYANGGRETIATDKNWRHSTGPILFADFYDGEEYDARLEMPGWSTPAFDAGQWRKVILADAPKAKLTGIMTEPVRKHEELKPIARTQPARGLYIFDLGQNIVGWARIKVKAPAGTKLTIRFAEMLQEDGNMYTENLRTARCTDYYTCKGGGAEVWEPRFTFHGFRYVEISGLEPGARIIDVAGIVLHSEIPSTGSFECSDKLLNQLQRNIVWGQRGNYLEAPTDCPQRDERLGWTGDAQVFVRTGTFNRDIAAFFSKWCLDMADSQFPDGCVPHVVPDVLNRPGNKNPAGGAAAWADAVVICPWTIYLAYGDTAILERNFDSMVAWVEWRRRTSRDLIHPRSTYGDWLAPDQRTQRDLIATAYFAHTSRIVSQTAKIIGRVEEAKTYAALARDVAAAFRREFISASGRIDGNTQTTYLLALGFDLLTPKQIPIALERLVEDIEQRGDTLSTGFVGTPMLAPVLTRFGRTDVAYRLVTQRNYPSWLFSVLQGATTMWERWNSYSIKDGFGDAKMNSFNHYAYGAIGEWLYATVAGIDLDPGKPGYKHIIFAPQPGGGLTWAKAELLSRYGRVASSWRIEEDRFLLDIVVPPNTTGTVKLPGQEPIEVLPGQHSFSASAL